MTGQKTDSGAAFRNNRIVLTTLFVVIFVSIYLFLKIYIYPPSENNVSYRNNNFYVFGLNIPAHLDFCGEPIPSNDIRIKKYLEKEFVSDEYWQNHSRELFSKAQRWFPVIEPILKEEGVPDDFKYLAVIESHLSNVTSPAGASGFWQLVPSSAANYGLEINENVDERYNVERATRAACGHILDAYKVFKSWTLSAAAYNRGIGGIQNALKAQGSDNYFDLVLNSETGSFVYRLLAFKTLLSSPSHFGINKKHKKGQGGLPFKIYKIDSTVSNIHQLAAHLGTSEKDIRAFNPWWLGHELQNPARKRYEIKIPKHKKASYAAYAADLQHNRMNDDTATEKTERADSLTGSGKTIYYVVKVDEPLKNLAAFFKIKEEDLRSWNNLGEAPNAVRGQTLLIHYQVKQSQ